MQLDHIKGLGNGGNNDLLNIQVLCIACHGDKKNKRKQMDTLILLLLNNLLIL